MLGDSKIKKTNRKFSNLNLKKLHPELLEDRDNLSRHLYSNFQGHFIILNQINNTLIAVFCYESLKNFIKGLTYKTSKGAYIPVLNYEPELPSLFEEKKEIFAFIKDFKFEKKYEEKVTINIEEIWNLHSYPEQEEAQNIINALEEIVPKVKYCEELLIVGKEPEILVLLILEMFKSKPKKVFYQENLDKEIVRLR